MFNLSQQFDALKQSLVGYVLMLAAAIIGLIWISFGIYNWATAILGPVWGPLAIGAAFLLPVAVYVLIKIAQPDDKRSKQQRMFDEAFAASPVGSLSKMIETMSVHSPFLAAVTAIVGGFVAARFPQFLSILSELVIAGGDELTRWKSGKSERAAYKTAEYDRKATPPPPPDVEPTRKRRGKKADADFDMYGS
ncbi:hypothetical protein ABI_46970 [Asticcacaulis biprosthecium C19]|uniref:Uncharacterized protein n=1 Tax=Asticcacaulis biprosthecium C19 TaxID=715226 RepID=F4QU49_9CAUL|nr:hypothetical protein [Asticcacaulis biprosthecium]EGF89349.1 hypothetical protein ABI_46970 [Asticcacaulis biprosthecium C19]